MHYDIIIIGGGMVGASLACALTNLPLRIALVDATCQPASEDNRKIALNHQSFCFYQSIRIWDALFPHATPINMVHISDRGHFGKIRLHAADVNVSALGYVIRAKHINQILAENIRKQTNLTLYCPAKLIQLNQDSKKAYLQIQAGEEQLTLQASLVIGADGSHSTVRELLKIDVEQYDYQQSALVTETELTRPHQFIAYERFHPGGATAMLPLAGLTAATIWTDSNSVIAELMQLDDQAFLKKLQSQFGYRLGRLKQTARRQIYPLKMLRAKQVKKQHTLLIGNAAHTLHPIAAQGLNLALTEIAQMTEHLQKHPINKINWQSFLSFQQKQQQLCIQLSHDLPQLFSSNFFPINFLRQLGMLGLDMLPFAKRRFTAKAMGKINY